MKNNKPGEDDPFCLLKFNNYRIFVLILSLLFNLYFFSCSLNPAKMTENVKIEEASVSFQPVGPISTFNVKISGYPPFILEVYDNPHFEGEPTGRIQIDKEGDVDLQALPSPILSPVILARSYYIRARSVFGGWTVFSDKNGDPHELIFLDPTRDPGATTLPFSISSPEDLIDFSNGDSRFSIRGERPSSNSYILTSDIDLSGYTWKTIGTVNEFTGTFNGNGHIISGINSIDSGGSGVYGLFGEMTTGSSYIINLGVELGELKAPAGVNYVGGLVANIDGGALISNCYVKGKEIRGGLLATDGLVGAINTGGRIKNCYSDITVEGKGRTGGFIGAIFGVGNSSTVISDCFSLGDVFYSGQSGRDVGGFCGYVESIQWNPVNCVALNKKTENISGGNGKIHFFGNSLSLNGSVNTYYNRKVISPQGSPVFNLTAGMTSAPLNPFTISQNTAPFNSWDFAQTWKWNDSLNHPVLIKVGR